MYILCTTCTYYVHHAYYVQHVHMLHHVTRVSTDWACPVAHGKEKKMATSPSIVQALATLAGALSSTSQSQAATPGSSRSQEGR